MKKIITLIMGIVLIASVLSLSGCVSSSQGTDKKTEITLAGGTALVPIAKETGKIFMERNPSVVISVSGGGSGFGIREVAKKNIDIGMAGRDLTEEEKKKYPNLVVYKIGIDGVAVVVNPSNPVSDLTKEQLKEIFSGKIKNWKEVGGKDEPINIYTRDENSGTRDTFWKYALDKGNITDKSIVVASNGEMRAKIASDKNGIGYLSVGFIDNSVKPVKLDGVEPTQENVQKGIYKVYRPLNMITNGKPEGMVKKYIDFVLSPEGQKIVQQEGFIPAKPVK